MCVVCFKPANQKLKKDVLERCYKANGDGCGFAFPDNGAVVIEKGRMDFEDFWNRFDAAQNAHEVPMIVHFRIRSSGEINDLNCHPFRIDAQHALVHNGTIWDFNATNSKASDTFLFNLNILQPLFQDYPNFYQTKYGRHLIEKTIGSSKMVILDGEGQYVIFNESAGEWDENVWYSNKSYLPLPPKKEKKKKKKFDYPNQPNGRRYSQRKKKADAYRALVDIFDVARDICIPKGDILSQNDLSKTVHHFKKLWKQRKCKVGNLVDRRVVEAVYYAEGMNNTI